MRVVITHGHIFKNAGTTFDWALKRNFGKGFCDHRDDVPMRRRGVRYLQEYLDNNPEIKAISSHHMCDSTRIQGIKPLPVFFIRHPLLRALSVYNFERKQKSKTPGSVAAKKYDFKDYVKWRMQPDVGRTIRDYQVAYLAGANTIHSSKKMDQNLFLQAVRKFIDGSLIGVVEDFDRSLTLIESELKKYFPELDLSYVRQNTGTSINTSKSKINYISDELGDVFDNLLQNNSFDFAIYRMAKDHLEKRIREIDDFPGRMESYIERCNCLK